MPSIEDRLVAASAVINLRTGTESIINSNRHFVDNMPPEDHPNPLVGMIRKQLSANADAMELLLQVIIRMFEDNQNLQDNYDALVAKIDTLPKK